MKCPICDSDFSNDIFCKLCGFEQVIISKNASDTLKDFLKQKTDNNRNQYNNVLLVNSKVKELESELSEAKKEISEITKKNIEIEKKLKATEGKVLVTQKEINELIVYKTEFEKQKKQVNDLQTEVKSYKSKMKNIDDYEIIRKRLNLFMTELKACHPNRFNEITRELNK